MPAETTPSVTEVVTETVTETVNETLNVDLDNLDRYADTAVELSMSYGPKLLLAIFTLLLGLWLIRLVNKGVSRAMEHGKIDETLRPFLGSLTNVVLKGVLFVSVISMIGVETTSLIAMLGAMGLAIGLALQGSLANFAGGVLILFFQPYKVGDVIEAQSFVGVIKEIQIFNTIMLTLDNQRVIIPNGIMSNDCIKNVFAEDTRRVDMVFGVSYTDDVAKVRSVLQEVISKDNRILADPGPDIFLAEHGDSSINWKVRVWVESADYWPVYFAMHEEVKLAFDREQISIPFPQRDVHLFQNA
jgi:small conductance mechanosensitive channel